MQVTSASSYRAFYEDESRPPEETIDWKRLCTRACILRQHPQDQLSIYGEVEEAAPELSFKDLLQVMVR